MRKLAVAVAVLLASAAPAAAEEVVTYRASGSAPDAAGDADDKTARTTALDEAFREATQRALGDLASAEALAGAGDKIAREILRRARLWVAKFKVVDQKSEGGTMTLAVDVRIDVEKLRDKLGELGVEIKRAPTPSQLPFATLLMRLSTVEGSSATYGVARQDAVPGARELGLYLVSRYRLLDAPATGDSERIDDDAARSLAADAGAEVAIVVDAEQGAPGRVRGARGVAALSRATVRVIDARGVIGQARAARGALGESAGEVTARALTEALLEAGVAALPAPEVAAEAADLPAAGSGEVLVRIRGGSGAQVAAIRAALAAEKGASARLRRLGAGEVVLVAKKLKADRIARLIREVGEAAGATVEVVGAVVEVEIR